MFETVESAPVANATPVVESTVAAPAANTNYPGSVTLVVTPQDTLILNYLLLSGTKLSLALRSSVTQV